MVGGRASSDRDEGTRDKARSLHVQFADELIRRVGERELDLGFSLSLLYFHVYFVFGRSKRGLFRA